MFTNLPSLACMKPNHFRPSLFLRGLGGFVENVISAFLWTISEHNSKLITLNIFGHHI